MVFKAFSHIYFILLPFFLYGEITLLCFQLGLPWLLGSKESVCQYGDSCSIPGSGRCPREGNDNSLQYSCQENSMDKGAWRATVHGVKKSQRQLNK